MTSYPPEPWTLVGRMDLSTFLVPTDTLPTATWPDGWSPLALAGRTPVGAAWVDYAPGGVMSYRELLVAVAGRVGARVRPHVVAIWVDSPASRDGGRELWGIPKGLASFTGFDEGTPSITVEGTERPAARAVLRRGARLPGRPRVGFTLAQERHGRCWQSPVTSRHGIGLLRADWTFDPEGPLGFLAGHRPLVSATLHDFAMSFGMTPHDRAQVGQPGVHADAQRQKSPRLGSATRR
ncbi:acetoacetate decarboxylase family protein [Actinomycetospora straminea]|uniref:Acetoacetate decarboxylase family protein n=1 Tax=Actinomycetospora straminea TaxID=663607 RepID=A0ABP9E4U7_9PSEU|nr:acetoacetate decarboxylase family protein [Actinomycetospora straminea]MDD7931350.1 acetoacetate decarboxylase family protein [Actinomycetospora straminea]